MVVNILVNLFYRPSSLWTRSPSASPQPSASPSPQIPLRTIEHIANQTAGSNVFFFGFAFSDSAAAAWRAN
jgi:hypothetical protein